MDEKVDSGGGIHDRSSRCGIAGERDRAARARRSEDLLRSDHIAVRELDRLSALQSAPLPPRGHTECVGACDIEAPRAGCLADQVPESLRTVVDSEGADLVVASLDDVTRIELDGLDGVGQRSEDTAQGAEEIPKTRGAVEREWHIAPPQRERLEHAGQAEIVIGVEMREQDVLEVDQSDIRAEQLPLGALAAIDQETVAAPPDERCRCGPLGGGSRTRRPEEHNVQIHGRGV